VRAKRSETCGDAGHTVTSPAVEHIEVFVGEVLRDAVYIRLFVHMHQLFGQITIPEFTKSDATAAGHIHLIADRDRRSQTNQAMTGHAKYNHLQ